MRSFTSIFPKNGYFRAKKFIFRIFKFTFWQNWKELVPKFHVVKFGILSLKYKQNTTWRLLLIMYLLIYCCIKIANWECYPIELHPRCSMISGSALVQCITATNLLACVITALCSVLSLLCIWICDQIYWR